MDDWREWFQEHRLTLALGAFLALAGLGWWLGRAVTQPAGILVAEEPLQSAPESEAPWTFRKHRLTALARFELRARVLSTERYRFDRAAELSPVDFALGWGPMSDSRVLEAITIQQRDRWYFWSAPRLPIPAEEITTHSANMHMIPANALIEKRLLVVRPGQVVALRGKLVRADGPDNWHWISSLSRADTGDGSCEVVWVDSVSLADH